MVSVQDAIKSYEVQPREEIATRHLALILSPKLSHSPTFPHPKPAMNPPNEAYNRNTVNLMPLIR